MPLANLFHCTAGEAVSEEENSGEDEDLACLKEDGVSLEGHGKGKRKKKHKSSEPIAR